MDNYQKLMLLGTAVIVINSTVQIMHIAPDQIASIIGLYVVSFFWTTTL